MARDLPPPVACKACPAMVRWALRIEGWTNIPLEVTPDPQGEWVAEWDDQLKQLLALPYDYLHHHGRERYRSHLSRCRLPQRGPGSPQPPKPDSTAGLKFPRRPARLNWDRPTGPDQVDDFVRALTPAERRWAEAELPEIAKRWPGVWRFSSHG